MNQVIELPPKTGAISTSNSITPVIPKNLDDVFRLAKMVGLSGMAPKDQDTPEKISAVILIGMEVGMPPMMALQSIAMINGRPTIWGDALPGLVRGSGECEYIKEWIEGKDDDRIAHCETKRKHELEPTSKKFSVNDAKRASLWDERERYTNKYGKEVDNQSPWYRYPERMLQMRARAFCLRDAYADILRGMQVREEVEDYKHQDPDNAKNVTPEKSDFADRLEQAKADTVDREFQGFDIDHVNSEMAQAGVSTTPAEPDESEIVDVEVDEPAPEPDPRAEAFTAGRQARSAGKPLLSVPDEYKDELAEAWQDGWREETKLMDEQ